MTENQPYPSQTLDRFIVRLPDGMRDRIAAVAKAAGRSMNAEIVARLETSFLHGDGRAAEIANLEAELTKLGATRDFLTKQIEQSEKMIELANDLYANQQALVIALTKILANYINYIDEFPDKFPKEYLDRAKEDQKIIEFIAGRPVSEKTAIALSEIGMAPERIFGGNTPPGGED